MIDTLNNKIAKPEIRKPGLGLIFGLMVAAGLVLSACSEAKTSKTVCTDPIVLPVGGFSVETPSKCDDSYMEPMPVVVWNLDDLPAGTFMPGQALGRSVVVANRDQDGKIIGVKVAETVLNGDINETNFKLITIKETTGVLWAGAELKKNGDWLNKLDTVKKGYTNDSTEGLGNIIPELDAGSLLYDWIKYRSEMIKSFGNLPPEAISEFDQAASAPWITTCQQVQFIGMLWNNKIIGGAPNEDIYGALCEPLNYLVNAPYEHYNWYDQSPVLQDSQSSKLEP